jgi:high-affinity nickel permease
MSGLDERIAHLGTGDALLAVLAVAILLGIRHATDPDHLTAVTTLVAGDDRRGSRRAGRLGLAWGLGHATTLLAFGIPIVLFKSYLPETAQKGAEVAVGVVIMALAARLLARRRRGEPHGREHRLAGRSPLQAYGVGFVHGLGGSAGVGVLLLAGLPDHAVAVAALAVFALGSALSMAAVSSGFGFALTREPVLRRFQRVAPALGVAGLAFGAWYALGALNAVPYRP